MYAIEIENLTKNYKKNRGINNISLKINKGEIFGFVAPNGAGKSTTIRTLLGFIYKTSGRARIFEKDIEKESKDIKDILGYVPSEVKFYDDVKVKDIINYSASFYKGISEKTIEKLCDIFEVEIDKKIGELSLGNRKKVALVQAFIHKPKLLILDEPTNGLDPLIQKRLFEYLIEEKKKGTTIFLSSHNLKEVENLCDRVAVIKGGDIVDVIDVNKLGNKKNVNVTISCDEISEGLIKDLGGTNIVRLDNKLTFLYDKNINDLISEVSKFNIKQILISEQSLEEIFMNYYKEEVEK